MSSHAWGGDRPGLAGKHHWGVGSIGIPAALIAAGGYLDASVDQAADPLAEYYAIFKGTPSGLVLEEVGEDGGIVANSPTTNAFYAIPFDLYRWGTPDGSSKITLTFGTPPAGALSALTMAGQRSMSRGAVTYAPPVGGVAVLAGSLMTGRRTMSTGAITYTPPYVPPVPGDIDASKVPAARTVSFQGNVRVVTFPGNTRKVTF